MDIKENVNVKDSGINVKGKIEILDKHGNILLTKNNLVVLRGRAFILEKLFEDEENGVSATHNAIYDSDKPTRPKLRRPCLFTIGTGGAQSTGASSVASPSPFLPSYTDLKMTSQVPFISGAGQGGNTYFKQEGDNYYAKVFDSVTWGYNEASNEVFKKITLSINSNEARGYTINELGLLIGKPEYDTSGNIERIAEESLDLMTRVTFTGIPLTGSDTFTINYYLYA